MSSSSSFRHSSSTSSTRYQANEQYVELGTDILFDVSSSWNSSSILSGRKTTKSTTYNRQTRWIATSASVNIKRNRISINNKELNNNKRRNINRQQKNKTTNHGPFMASKQNIEHEHQQEEQKQHLQTHQQNQQHC